MNRLGPCLVAVTLAIPLASCGDKESARDAKTQQEATPQRLRADGSIELNDQDQIALGLVVSAVNEADLPDTALRFGHVLSPPGSEGQVVAPVTGRITRPALVALGGSVRAGAALVDIVPSLDTPDRIAVGAQSAERAGHIEAAERELAKAESEATRARELSPQIVSAAKLQEAETTVATARAHLDGFRNARAASDRAQTQGVPVTTPITGVVSALSVDVGALVNKGDVLAKVLADGPIWVDVSVPPDEPVGSGYMIDVPSGPLSARLLTRGRVTDADGTRHDRLEVAAPAARALAPGSAVPVHVAHGASRGIVLPESALVPGVEGETVFMERSPGVFIPQAVQVDARFGGRARVRSGVPAGARVVVQGAMALQGERLRSQLRNVEQ